MFLTLLTLVAALLWIIILLLPWRPWSTREFLEVFGLPSLTELPTLKEFSELSLEGGEMEDASAPAGTSEATV